MINYRDVAVLALAFVFLLVASSAHAQSTGQSPGGQTVLGSVTFCPNGLQNKDGTFQVVPCGSVTNPQPVSVGNAYSSPAYAFITATGVGQCPPNPITKIAKAFPFCY